MLDEDFGATEEETIVGKKKRKKKRGKYNMGLDMWLNDSEGNVVMYWRKANQIHKWFSNLVDWNEKELINGFKVTKEQLRELVDCITRVLESKDLADDVLPTQKGFFFGSYDYDEWYFDELVRTKHDLEIELNKDSDEEYTYSASW